ncbi:FHA domain-containing protein [Longispora sp. K20-0274]|uniref:FHA domain-containing protein n=1 Tax=Longispora sp. K20-0274 TaxID=3088255 RepID=UPI00399B6973
MTTCPAGHDSGTTDYCDVCGTPIEPALSAVPAPPVVARSEGPCPECGAASTGRYCEDCGYDYTTGPAPQAAPEPVRPNAAPVTAPAWTAVVSADRAYHETVTSDIAFPPYCPDRAFPLTGATVRIGRRTASRGAPPEIDLAGPPEDSGVSHLHAVLLAGPDDTWALVDPGSTNGTFLNGGTDPVAVNTEHPVRAGDRIHLGAWTTITLRKD